MQLFAIDSDSGYRSFLASSSKFNFSSYLLQLNCTMYLIPSQTVQDWPTSLHSPACLIQLEDSLQIYLSHNAFRAGIHSLRPNHEMQSQIKTIKSEKSYWRRAPQSNLELSAILNQTWELQKSHN